MSFLARRSLAFFLGIILLVTSSVVLGVSGAVTFQVLRQREVRRVSASLDTKIRTAVEALSLPLWNLDDLQIRRLLDTLVKDRAVVGARVRVEGGGRSLVSGRVEGTGVRIEALPILMEGQTLGTLEVFWSPRPMEEELSLIRRTLFLGLLAFDGLLVVGLYALIWVLVVRPIRNLERFAGRVARGDAAWDEPWREPPCREMHSLHQAIREMVGLLDQRYRRTMESEQRFRALFDGSSEAVFMRELSPHTMQTPLLEVNETACRMLGYSREELLAKSPYDLITEEDWPEIDAMKGRLERGEPVLLGTTYLARDGRRIPVEVSANSYAVEGRLFVMSAVRDVSERHRLEEQLRHSQKMESLGLLAGGIAHDFNNLLQVMGSYAELLEEDVSLGSPGLEKLEQIRNAVSRATQLTRGLLAFSRRQAIRTELVELNGLVQRVETFLRRVIGEDITLVARICAEGLPVRVDEGQIEQVLMNLATNARDAMGAGGLLCIITEGLEMDEDFVRLHGFGTPGPWASVVVSDTGSGMDEATRARIFDPFFSTKAVGKGTGLGLAIVYGIVQQHRGHITVYSEPGRGTTFRVYLPLAPEAESAQTLPARLDPGELRGKETILLVEDEDAVRRVVASVLAAHGYAVLEARDGLEAQAVYEEHAPGIRLILSDLRMPKVNGRELFEALHTRVPGLPFLFMSGYPPEVIQSLGELDPGADLIMKPFQPGELLSRIRQILDRS
nr:ATP-binding protein [uncultured Holophaga sp.]